MNSNRSMIPAAFLAALLLGALVIPLDRSISRSLGQGGEMGSLKGLESSLGQGLSVAILGGYRSIAANMTWLSQNADWEKKDLAGTYHKLSLAVGIDPRPSLFWLNGARVIANDMPVWIVGESYAEQLQTTERGRAVAREYAERALRFLEKSRSEHADNPEIYIEEGMIFWRKLGDLENAAERFLRATQTSEPPYYASRIYAELLLKLGRSREALDFLEKHYETLPDDAIEAMKPVVEQRILLLRKSLER